MRLAFHPLAQQNAFRRRDDHRGADLISDVVLLSPTWANAYFIRGYCLQDLHRLAEAKKAIAQAVALSPNVPPESGIRRFSLQFPQTPRLRQETLVFSSSMFNRLLRTAYVLLPGSRKRLWHDYCFIAGNFKIMNIPNKTFLVLMIGAASLAVFGPMASADTMQLTLDYGSRHSGVGGEFNAYSPDFAPLAMGYDPTKTIYNAGPGAGFETFCMEYNEHFTPGSSYYYGISQGAIDGGVSGGNPDPISRGTAWLYLQFAHRHLRDTTTPDQMATSAGALQDTIWWLEGERADDPHNIFSMAVTNQFGGAHDGHGGQQRHLRC